MTTALPTNATAKLGDEFTVDGVSYTIVSVDFEHWNAGRAIVHTQHFGRGNTFCHACPLNHDCSKNPMEARCGRHPDYRVLRTDLIPLFTLEGMLT